MRRIQRKRTEGWRIPENTIYVGRPTKWGNPFKIHDDNERENAIAKYRVWLEARLLEDPAFLDELRGKDLVCWCSLKDKDGKSIPCHADVIIKVMKERRIA